VKKQSIILACIAVLALLGLVVATFVYKHSQDEKRALLEQDKTRMEHLVRPDSHALGAENAKVTVVEFFDPECETCRLVYPGLKEFLKYYDGKIRLVLRYMPLHLNSMKAATALEAAGEQGKFWELLNVMFERQPEWADHHSPKPELVRGFAKDLGLDMAKYDQSLTKPEHKDKIQRDQADGYALGVSATPMFFVNGRTLVDLSFEALKDLVDEELGKGGP